MAFRLVVVESPFAGDIERNMRYLRACLADCIRRGESPYASHGLLTQPGVLDDSIAEQRELGIAAGVEWARVADAVVVYWDLGVSRGMLSSMVKHEAAGRVIEMRQLGGEWT